eukprot:CAMPEP_0184484210 /NCGR_PEP_ID=MMETSP0113_2-20130426/5920_1 /TAXON_ID=91329 /ORGANISM="Norrisiella sphaerica, Strain BC52" /LENGTH=473 /DNA_ID=CAMNT_0026865083 /DNA_START=352 /DNA_END=1773 /DNA_ORIENTATION=-
MAGNRMVLISDEKALTQYQAAKEETLSLYDAIYDFGFKETLGPENVYSGALTHKRILRGLPAPQILSESALRSVEAHFLKYISENCTSAVKEDGITVKAEVFHMMRSVSLDVSLCTFVGDSFAREVLDKKDKFRERFLEYQDLIEDATAQATVLPRVLSSRILNKVRILRAGLVAEIVAALEKSCLSIKGSEVSAEGKEAVTEFFRQMIEEAGKGPSDYETENTKPKLNGIPTVHRIAEYIIGLLFAAHKNVAITSAQVVIMLLEHPDAKLRVLKELSSLRKGGQDESKSKLSSSSPLAFLEGDLRVEDLNRLHFLDKCIQETLRLIQHSIGSMRKVRSNKGFHFRTSDGRKLNVPRSYYVGVTNAVIGREKFFASPENFDPDAHFKRDERGKLTPLVEGRDRHSHIPFSGGIHLCPGFSVAPLLIKALVVEWFRLAADSGDIEKPVPKLNFERATVAQRDGPCYLIFRHQER